MEYNQATRQQQHPAHEFDIVLCEPSCCSLWLKAAAAAALPSQSRTTVQQEKKEDDSTGTNLIRAALAKHYEAYAEAATKMDQTRAIRKLMGDPMLSSTRFVQRKNQRNDVLLSTSSSTSSNSTTEDSYIMVSNRVVREKISHCLSIMKAQRTRRSTRRRKTAASSSTISSITASSTHDSSSSNNFCTYPPQTRPTPTDNVTPDLTNDVDDDPESPTTTIHQHGNFVTRAHGATLQLPPPPRTAITPDMQSFALPIPPPLKMTASNKGHWNSTSTTPTSTSTISSTISQSTATVGRTLTPECPSLQESAATSNTSVPRKYCGDDQHTRNLHPFLFPRPASNEYGSRQQENVNQSYLRIVPQPSALIQQHCCQEQLINMSTSIPATMMVNCAGGAGNLQRALSSSSSMHQQQQQQQVLSYYHAAATTQYGNVPTTTTTIAEPEHNRQYFQPCQGRDNVLGPSIDTPAAPRRHAYYQNWDRHRSAWSNNQKKRNMANGRYINIWWVVAQHTLGRCCSETRVNRISKFIEKSKNLTGMVISSRVRLKNT